MAKRQVKCPTMFGNMFKRKALTKYENTINIDRLILNLVLTKYTSIDFMKIFSTPFICLQNKI